MKSTLTATAAALVLAFLPAHAAPEAEVLAVFQSDRCGAELCEPGIDPQLARGANARGAIEIHVRAENISAIEWVRLEARYGNHPRWVCMEHWVADDQTSFTASFDWLSTAWPDPGVNSSCIENSFHYHGLATQNGAYHVRVVARERGLPGQSSENRDGTSDPFTIQVNNPPVAPTWVGQPSASTSGDPAVTLRWKPNDERDLREYLIVRQAPSGRETETAISARKPSSQGCTLVGDVAITCVDRAFPARFGGTYRYAIVAVRAASAGAQRCTLSDRRCIESPLSEPMSVTLAGPTARAPTVSPSAPSTPSSPGATPPFDPGRFGGLPTTPALPEQPSLAPVPVASGERSPLPGTGLLGPAAFALAAAAIGWQLRRSMLARR